MTAVAEEEDDWESEYTRSELVTESSNKKLWNSSAPFQTPSVIINKSQSNSTQFIPPSTAFIPTLRILKRPTNLPEKVRGVSSGIKEKTLEERERDYKEARDRIYGITPSPTSSNRSSSLSIEKLSLSSARSSNSSEIGNSTSGNQKSNSRRNKPMAEGTSGIPVKGTVEVIRKPRGPDGNGFASRA